MASLETIEKLQEHPEWIAPRSDTRVFLGQPGAPEATKTTVEPGNTFSPGMRTFGVTWWLRFPRDDSFLAPELAPIDSLVWRYDEGFLPLIHCDVEANEIAVRHSLFQDGEAADFSEAVCGRLELVSTASESTDLQLFIALRSLGPAGGPIPDLTIGADGASFWLSERNLPLMGVDQPPTALGCGVGDPSAWARRGDTPAGQCVQDAQGWCFGLMRYDLSLAPGDSWRVRFDCPQQTYGNLEDDVISTASLRPEQFEPRRDEHLAAWRARLGSIDLDVPDPDFRSAFFAGLQHMLTAIVGEQARITPLAYPLPWLRDSIFIIRSLDLAGLHEQARVLTEYCARNDFFGGFGAEGDSPGQGIWAIVQHYRLTNDRAWLEQHYAAIQRKCAWLVRMRRTERPIQIIVDTPTLAYTHAERASGIICLAAADGLIRGSMDHGIDYSVGWINQWAICGLREAAYAASELDERADAVKYQTEADELFDALRAFADRTPDYFAHDRTAISLLWPTRTWEGDPSVVAAPFDEWWQSHRGTTEEFIPEPLWIYFEFAQAHNALLLGAWQRVWDVLSFRFQHQDVPGLYGWREGGNGIGTRNASQGVTLFHQLRGCQRFDSITPHGWSNAEMWLLQRAMLVEEWQDGLLLFAGVPPWWLTAGNDISFRDFPTWFGKVSAKLTVNASGTGARVIASGIAPGTRVTVRLVNQTVTHQCDGDGIEMEIELA